jgi:hypothetical protein
MHRFLDAINFCHALLEYFNKYCGICSIHYSFIHSHIQYTSFSLQNLQIGVKVCHKHKSLQDGME